MPHVHPLGHVSQLVHASGLLPQIYWALPVACHDIIFKWCPGGYLSISHLENGRALLYMNAYNIMAICCKGIY